MKIMKITNDLQQNFQILVQLDKILEHWQIHLPEER